MPVAPVNCAHADQPYSVAPVNTSWKRLMVSDIETEAGVTSLKESIADNADLPEINFRGAAASPSMAIVSACYIGLWNVVDPDTGEDVDWSSGRYLGVDVWFKFGENDPSDAAKQACYVGVYGPSNTVLSTGVLRMGNTTLLAAATYSSSDRNSTTQTTDSVFYGNHVVAPDDDETNANVLWAYGSAYHFDDAATPGRLQSCLTASLAAVAGADIKIMLAMAGDCDVSAYYRLVKVPNDPQSSLTGN